jgi:phage shock protein PspC (stress-responsive transcriptional regulator)
MQRVVSINLNGGVFQLEETGYNALFAYLDARETQLQDDPDRAQKMADLERQMAEKCAAYVTPTKNIITSAEIDAVIREFGPAPTEAEAAASASRQSSQRNSASSSSSSTSWSSTRSTSSGAGGSGAPFPHRRLYQVREGAMISGVCVGLSEYMRIDVTLLRILFVIFAFVSSGWGILVYGLLMFVLPSVATRADAVAGSSAGTHHWPWDDGWPWDKYGWPWDRYGWPWDHPTEAQQRAREQELGARLQPRTTATPPPPSPTSPPPASPPTPSTSPSSPSQSRDARQEWRDQRREWRDQRREWRAQRRAARMEYHPFPIWGTISGIIFLAFAFMWLSFWTRGHFFFGWPFFWGFPHWIGIIFFFLMLRLIFVPFRAARWYGYGYGPYGPYPHPAHAWISMWNGLAWFLMLIFGVWLAYHYIPEVHDFIRSFDVSWNGGNFHV